MGAPPRPPPPQPPFFPPRPPAPPAGPPPDALGEGCNACLLQNHGTVTVGAHPEEAFARTVVLEEMAEIYYRTRIAGEPVLLSPGQIEEVAAKISGYGQAKPASTDNRG